MSIGAKPSKSTRLALVLWTTAALVVVGTAAVFILRPSGAAKVSWSTTGSNPPTPQRHRPGRAAPRNGDELLADLRARVDRGEPLNEVARVVLAFARQKPAEALDAVRRLGLPGRDARILVLPSVAHWVNTDPTSSWRWTLATGTSCDVPGQEPLCAVVLSQVAATKPELVVPLFTELLASDPAPAGLSIAAVADIAIAELLQRDPKSAWNVVAGWATLAHGDRLTAECFARVALADAAQDPMKAAGRLQTLPDRPARTFALAALAEEWAKSDPHAALRWAQDISTADTRSNVRRAAFARWEQSDMMAAADWLAAQPAGPEADTLIAEVVADPRAVRANVHAVLSLADSISDPRLRHQGVESIVRRWSESDPGAATEYIVTTKSLSVDEKHELLESIRPNDDDPES